MQKTPGAHLQFGKGLHVRLFVAAEMAGADEALAETSALLRDCVHGRFVAPDSLHVTLAFIGEVEAWRVDDALEAVDEANKLLEGPFPVALGDFGSFGKRSCATLWQGFSETGELDSLANNVRHCLRERGFSLDEKRFLPHITLMRKADLTNGALPAPIHARAIIAGATLYRSDLSGARPRYEPLS